MRDTCYPPVPVVAHLRHYRQQHVAEKFEGRQDRRERLICWSMAVTSYFCSAAASESVSIGAARVGATWDTALPLPLAARWRSSASLSPATRPMARPCSTAPRQQSQARNLGVGVHPAPVVADGRDGVMPALPGAQRVDTDTGQLGDRPDRIARSRIACFPHRAALLPRVPSVCEGSNVVKYLSWTNA